MADGPSSSASPPTEAPSERPPPEPGVLRWAVERRQDEVREAAVTPAVERIWRVAATLTSEAARRQNLAFDRPPLLAAILASATNVGDWARRWNGGAAFGAALDHAKVGASRATGADPDVETRNLWLVSASADELLRDAQDLTPAWASMDAHHLVGAIILSRYGNDPFVKDDDVRQRWAIDFGRYIDRYFRKDVGNWETHIRRRFPDITLPAYHAELAKVPRSDRWAELDELGREPFVDALAQLLNDPATEAPMTIGIEAPWGTGKTTVMHQVQRRIGAEIPRVERRRHPGWWKFLSLVWTRGHPAEALNHRYTVWFNAWKYQNLEQAWAGLATDIVNQVADAQENPLARERFLLWLHGARSDKDAVRRIVYRQVIGGATTLIAAIFGLVVGWVSAHYAGFSLAQATPTTLSAFLAGHAASLAVKAAKGKGISNVLGKLLDVTDYRADVGGVRRAHDDMDRILRNLGRGHGEKTIRVVIFIDDLDRCSPSVVAALTEAVNLFLAVDLRHCAFVLAIDGDLVSAAIEAAHHDALAGLALEVRAPLGRRFLAKFIQVPVLLPAPSSDTLATFATNMLRPPAPTRAPEPAAHPGRPARADDPTTGVGGNAGPAGLATPAPGLVALDPRADGVALLIQRAIAFSDNPREINRYGNAAKLYGEVWRNLDSQYGTTLSLDQMANWIMLLVRWPHVITWTQRRSRRPDGLGRLALLETAAKHADDAQGWLAIVSLTETVPTKDLDWMLDADLFQFFAREGDLKSGERLSDGVGSGLW